MSLQVTEPTGNSVGTSEVYLGTLEVSTHFNQHNEISTLTLVKSLPILLGREYGESQKNQCEPLGI